MLKEPLTSLHLHSGTALPVYNRPADLGSDFKGFLRLTHLNKFNKLLHILFSVWGKDRFISNHNRVGFVLSYITNYKIHHTMNISVGRAPFPAPVNFIFIQIPNYIKSNLTYLRSTQCQENISSRCPAESFMYLEREQKGKKTTTFNEFNTLYL